MDESVSSKEAAEIVAEYGESNISEVKVGQMRPLSNGMYSVWAQCPLVAAIKIAKLGKVRVGWTAARVDLLKSRPTQCYRCWGAGHIQSKCRAETDKSKLCYRCGKPGHQARECLSELFCALCLSQGVNACHRVGSGLCRAANNSVDSTARGTVTHMETDA